jgi:hypothetical protein
MLDLRCHPGGIFAVAGTILMLDTRYKIYDVHPGGVVYL